MTEKIEKLWSKNAAEGCAAMKVLERESAGSDAVYRYMGQFLDKLGSDNSYFRTRALTLIAANAKWDKYNIIDENIDTILAHITDDKPITSRQFIRLLPGLAEDKPELREDILSALEHADTLRYPSSMRPLVDKDIREALLKIYGI